MLTGKENEIFIPLFTAMVSLSLNALSTSKYRRMELLMLFTVMLVIRARGAAQAAPCQRTVAARMKTMMKACLRGLAGNRENQGCPSFA